jgi:hypothetical protein
LLLFIFCTQSKDLFELVDASTEIESFRN